MRLLSRRGLRRRAGLLVSGGLVLLLGMLGVLAGSAATHQSQQVHRGDRLALQQTLAGLVEQYVLLSAAELSDTLAGGGPWSTAADDPVSAGRLQALVAGSRALDAGAMLVGPTGQPLISWSPGGAAMPAADDPGWAPLRSAVLRGDGRLPLSGVLAAGRDPLLALALPVPLAGGGRGLVVGLWHARTSGLQKYVSQLNYGKTGHGWVLDTGGLAVAAPDAAEVGERFPQPDVLRQHDTSSGVVDASAAQPIVASYARAGRTGWTAATLQDRAEFEGPLVRSGRLAQGAIVALLLLAGTLLVLLHRKRERALESVALRDDLTGLHNRRGWYLLAEHELTRATRQDSSRALLFLDLDGLKQVNDALGHRDGDRAILDAARVLTTATRDCDIVGRLGGDEFVLLLGEDGRPELARDRLLAAMAAHNEGSDAAFELRLSVGAEVWFPDSACTLDELVRRADARMYADKTSRPDRHIGVLREPQLTPTR